MARKPRNRSARSLREALPAWVNAADLRDAIAKRPTIADYEEKLKSADVRTGGATEAFREADVTTSIVFPLLNCEATLEAALESALQQAGHPEIVVVDGGSSDSTLSIVERYRPHIHRWLSEPDQGMYDAINKGIALCRGRIVHILNGDDLLPLDSVGLAMDHFRGRSDDGCLRGSLGRVALDGTYRETWTQANRARFDPEHFPFLHPSWYVPRAVYERHGLYLPYFRIAGDHEYALHLWDDGVRFSSLPAVLALFREGGMSMSATGWHEALETCAVYLGRPRAAALYSEMLFKKGRYAAVSRLIGPDRTAALWSRLKEMRPARTDARSNPIDVHHSNRRSSVSDTVSNR